MAPRSETSNETQPEVSSEQKPTSFTSPSPSTSSADLYATDSSNTTTTKSSSIAQTTNNPTKNSATHILKERAKIPITTYLITTLVFIYQYYGGVYTYQTFQSYKSSLMTSAHKTYQLLEYIRNICQFMFQMPQQQEQNYQPKEIVIACIASLIIGGILYVLVYAPLRAGMWTGQRARKHVIHRYMGLAFLIQYGAAWVEFMTNYENGGKDSFLPHFISTNGLIQGLSAYFSFRVLPELADAGYYSDKAVLSRKFVHENLYFSLLTFTGSVTYNNILRTNLQQHVLGKICILIFTFWPYILIRPLFPTTRFSDAGSSRAGRSTAFETFYKVGTLMVKFFYLWAKYFLGFYINMLMYKDLQSENDFKFIQGLFLLNAGTISISVFLHTLRFKKVLPPVLTFSFYLAQIYATFVAIPFAYQMFASHKKLCALCFLGIMVNMTRKRWMHGVWATIAYILLDYSSIQW